VLEGGCLCRFVRYQAGGTPFHETVCHCTMCRGSTGAPMVGWFSVRRDDFRLTSGELVGFPSSPRATRNHCPRCGTQITFQSNDYPGETDVTIASLNDPNAVPPKDHTFVRSKPAWVTLSDGLPQFETRRER
jgi:hypothetical protein